MAWGKSVGGARSVGSSPASGNGGHTPELLLTPPSGWTSEAPAQLWQAAENECLLGPTGSPVLPVLLSCAFHPQCGQPARSPADLR